MFVYIDPHFRFVLIGQILIAQAAGSPEEHKGGIQIAVTSLQALSPLFPCLLSTL